MEEALKALAPVSETLAGLRADMSRLATRLEQPTPDLAPAVETIRAEIDDLRSGIGSLATREEIAALDAALGSIAKDLEQGPTDEGSAHARKLDHRSLRADPDPVRTR